MDYGLRPSHSTYAVIDLYYIGGRHDLTWPILHQGGTVHVRRSGNFDATSVVEYVIEHGITHMLWVPTMLYEILRVPGLAERDTSKLEMIMSGGAPVPRATIEEAEAAIQAQWAAEKPAASVEAKVEVVVRNSKAAYLITENIRSGDYVVRVAWPAPPVGRGGHVAVQRFAQVVAEAFQIDLDQLVRNFLFRQDNPCPVSIGSAVGRIESHVAHLHLEDLLIILVRLWQCRENSWLSYSRSGASFS
jgi:acyl-CoA synthetase (AMP-forming)/AMP-acid ligase II